MLYLGAKKSLLSAGKTLAQQIAALFAAGEQGAWYDPSDWTTLFQDSAGTTPVTAVGQPIGRMLDKSGRGNHATQPTAINRPVLQARVNLLTETEFRNGVADAPTSSGVTAASLGGYLGAIAFGTPGSTAWAYKTLAHTNGLSYTMSLVVAMDDGLAPGFSSTATANSFSLVLFGLASSAEPLAGVVVSNLGSGRYRVSKTAVSTGAAVNFGVVKYAVNDARTFKVTGFHLEIGSVATLYQRVNTATDYDAVGFPAYLAFNGTNSWMSTAAIDFTATDKMTVVAGVRKLSDAAAGVVLELSANASVSPGALHILAPPGVVPNIAFRSGGTALSTAAIGGYSAPVSTTLTGIGDISGDSAVLRVNGVQAVQSGTDQGTGNYGNYPIYLGARAGSSLFFNGNLYGLLIRGALSTAPQIASAEKFMNGKTGAY